MIKALIVEDDNNNRELLAHFLTQYCEGVDIIDSCSNVKDSIVAIEQKRPDLVFMDIILEDGTAFEIIDSIPDFIPKIIFTTAYSDYAIRAFKHCAIDYLMKPIQIEDLIIAVDKVITQKVNSDYFLRLKKLSEKIEGQNDGLIAIPTIDIIEFINQKDVVFLKADGKYSEFNLINGKKVVSSRNIGEYEFYLDKSVFFRCHNSFIVNLSFAKSINKKDGYFFELENNREIPISRRRRKDIMERFNL